MNRRAFLAATAGTALFLAGCNQRGGSGTPAVTSSPTETATSTPSPPGTAGTTPKPALVANPDVVRTCERSIIGFHAAWNDNPVVIGPVAFSTFPQEGATESPPYKTPIVLKPKTVVTVVVPEPEREHIALSYDLDRNPKTLDQGQQSVRLEACADQITAFPGSIFAEINCVRLHLWVETEDAPLTVVLPFFGAKCP